MAPYSPITEALFWILLNILLNTNTILNILWILNACEVWGFPVWLVEVHTNYILWQLGLLPLTHLGCSLHSIRLLPQIYKLISTHLNTQKRPSSDLKSILYNLLPLVFCFMSSSILNLSGLSTPSLQLKDSTGLCLCSFVLHFAWILSLHLGRIHLSPTPSISDHYFSLPSVLWLETIVSYILSIFCLFLLQVGK